MRVGFQVSRGHLPVEGARIVGTLTTGFPFLPAMPLTNHNGEWFGVAPIFVSPGSYFMAVRVSEGGESVSIRGVFDEIENLFHVDLGSKTWQREKLPTRIPGDGYYEVDQQLLEPWEVVHLGGPHTLILPSEDLWRDPVLDISSCAQCLYYALPGAPSGVCLVNGAKTPSIPIDHPAQMTCRLYYPIFLHPISPQRAIRDLARGLPSG